MTGAQAHSTAQTTLPAHRSRQPPTHIRRWVHLVSFCALLGLVAQQVGCSSTLWSEKNIRRSNTYAFLARSNPELQHRLETTDGLGIRKKELYIFLSQYSLASIPNELCGDFRRHRLIIANSPRERGSPQPASEPAVLFTILQRFVDLHVHSLTIENIATPQTNKCAECDHPRPRPRPEIRLRKSANVTFLRLENTATSIMRRVLQAFAFSSNIRLIITRTAAQSLEFLNSLSAPAVDALIVKTAPFLVRLGCTVFSEIPIRAIIRFKDVSLFMATTGAEMIRLAQNASLWVQVPSIYLAGASKEICARIRPLKLTISQPNLEILRAETDTILSQGPGVAQASSGLEAARDPGCARHAVNLTVSFPKTQKITKSDLVLLINWIEGVLPQLEFLEISLETNGDLAEQLQGIVLWVEGLSMLDELVIGGTQYTHMVKELAVADAEQKLGGGASRSPNDFHPFASGSSSSYRRPPRSIDSNPFILRLPSLAERRYLGRHLQESAL
ncbi:hypothetical protein NEDG_01787 [Nematocida displodere]|uniref:Uncharacterized protein n=1 Tax=Nematocida displodere TaxID=1805483 RepID=A0A177EK01_9MICR|nr:hypothetical protein NEDG_01787 [Nematocida displodere]